MLKITHVIIPPKHSNTIEIQVFNEDTREYISIRNTLQSKLTKSEITKYIKNKLELKANITEKSMDALANKIPLDNIVEYMELDNIILINEIKFPELINLIQTSNKPIIGAHKAVSIRYIDNSINSLRTIEAGFNIIKPVENLLDLKNIYHNPIKIIQNYDMKNKINNDFGWYTLILKKSIIENITSDIVDNITIVGDNTTIKETKINSKALKYNVSINHAINKINHIYQNIVKGFITKTAIGGEALRYWYPGKAFMVYILPYLGINNIKQIIDTIDIMQNNLLKDILPLKFKELIDTNKMLKRLYNATNDKYLSERLESAKFKNADEVTELILNAMN